MAKYVYHLECTSGIAGDMFLGACLDLGMPLEVIVDAVRAVGLEGIELEHRRAQRGGITGSRFRVLVGGEPVEGADPEEVHARQEGSPENPHHQPHSHESRDEGYSVHGHESHAHSHAHGHDQFHGHSGDETLEVLADSDAWSESHSLPNTYKGLAKLVEDSTLEVSVRARALRMLKNIGEAEASVHGSSLESVHFHELASIDSVVDIVGAAAAMEYLDPLRVTCGEVVVGQGLVKTAHGVMSVPAPATARLLTGVPTSGGGEGELVTPTGALILRELVESFGPQPAMTVDSLGYGLGRKQVSDRSNSVRIARGVEAESQTSLEGAAEVTVIECQVDDASGEELGYAVQQLLVAGALDVVTSPVQMKKGRPGVLITMLCRHAQRNGLAEQLLETTGAMGCRYYVAQRLEAERSYRTVSTPYGEVRIKEGRLRGRVFTAQPEYEDCRELAAKADVPLRAVYQAAIRAGGPDRRENES